MTKVITKITMVPMMMKEKKVMTNKMMMTTKATKNTPNMENALASAAKIQTYLMAELMLYLMALDGSEKVLMKVLNLPVLSSQVFSVEMKEMKAAKEITKAKEMAMDREEVMEENLLETD